MRVFSKQYPFTKLQITHMARLSGQALKLYPFLVQNAFKRSFSVSLEDLKTLLSIDINSYPEFKEFKKTVLKPHLDQITLNTDLSISYVAEKLNGRKASHVRFNITEKKEVKAVKPSDPAPEPEKSSPPNPEKTQEVDQQKLFRTICTIIVKNSKLLERLKESGEPTEAMMNRIRDDFERGNSKRWTDKLIEFGVSFDA